VGTIEKILERKISGSGLENREYVRRGPAALTKATTPSIRNIWFYLRRQDGGQSVGIVLSRTKSTELVYALVEAYGVTCKWLGFLRAGKVVRCFAGR
jgi:hypothetical protein